MNVALIKNGKIALFDKDSGRMMRVIPDFNGWKILTAHFNNQQDKLAVTTEDGKVYICDTSNSSKQYIYHGIYGKAQFALWYGDEIAVQLETGKMEIYNQNGNRIRVIVCPF